MELGNLVEGKLSTGYCGTIAPKWQGGTSGPGFCLENWAHSALRKHADQSTDAPDHQSWPDGIPAGTLPQSRADHPACQIR